jgi:hypothetical protein
MNHTTKTNHQSIQTGSTADAEQFWRTLPFSCPFGAPKSGKLQQAPAQSEGRRSPDSSSDDAHFSKVQHTPAKGG